MSLIQLKMKISALFASLFCLASLLLTFVTMFQFMCFLSGQYEINPGNNDKDQQSSWNFLFGIWANISCVLAFMYQHSRLKTNNIASFLTRHHFSPFLARSIYVLSTSLTIQALMFFWTPISSHKLWTLEVEQTSPIWLVFSSIHILAWAFIYGGSLLLDFPELMGVKQVYYYFLSMPETNDLKSTELQRLYSHKRHPSFLGFLAVLWFIPVMSIDRFAVALALTLYSATAWEPTLDDKRYHQHQLTQKKQEIEYSNSRKSAYSEPRYYRG